MSNTHLIELAYTTVHDPNYEKEVMDSFGFNKMRLVNRWSYMYFLNNSDNATILTNNTYTTICIAYTTFNDKFYSMLRNILPDSPLEYLVNSLANTCWQNESFRLHVGSTTFGLSLGIFLDTFYMDDKKGEGTKQLEEILGNLVTLDVCRNNIEAVTNQYLTYRKNRQHKAYDGLDSITHQMMGLPPNDPLDIGPTPAELLDQAATMTTVHIINIMETYLNHKKVLSERVEYYKSHLFEITKRKDNDQLK